MTLAQLPHLELHALRTVLSCSIYAAGSNGAQCVKYICNAHMSYVNVKYVKVKYIYDAHMNYNACSSHHGEQQCELVHWDDERFQR